MFSATKRGANLLEAGVGSRRGPLAALVFAALFAALLDSAAQGQQTPSANKVELSAVLDTWIDAAAPDAVHGGDGELVARLEAGKGSRVLIGFDVSALQKSRVSSARLQLTLTGAAGQSVVAMAIAATSDPWTETTTWKSQPRTTSTREIRSVDSKAGAVTWEVADVILDALESKSSVVGISLSGPIKSSGPGYARTFASREAGTTGPTLTVETYEEKDVIESEEPTEPAGTQAVRIGLAALGASILAVGGILYVRKRRRRTAST